MATSSEKLAHIRQVLIVFGEEVDELVVAEEGVHIVCPRQYVATPPVQHRDLQKGREILRLVFQERVSRCFVR